MDYSQFLYMREELSLIAVLLLLFLADLFMSPDAHKKWWESTPEHNVARYSDGYPYGYQLNSGDCCRCIRRYVSLCTDAHSG